jgi:hypothetical protein
MNDVLSQCALLQTFIVPTSNSPVVLLQPEVTLTTPDTPPFHRSRGLQSVAGATGRGREQVFTL